MSCNICCDNYNKSNRSKVCCAYCDFDVCRSCCEKYILSETSPKCMNPDCAKEWSRKFLRENFTNVFLNSKYKEHLEDVLFDQEKALLPATQHIVEERIIKKKMAQQLREIEKLISDLQRQKYALINDIRDDIKVERSQFVRQCPSNGCRGFLSTQWKCGICEQWTCPDCHELKGPNKDCGHVCNPDNIETAKILAKDSKPCPKCQSLIFKIDGCDQMWCTQCHTAFSWKTGKLESNIHNPHFFEWQRKNGAATRTAGDILCGRELNYATVNRINDLAKKHNDLHSVNNINISKWDKQRRMEINETVKRHDYDTRIINICDIIRNIIHNNAIELPLFQTDYFIRNQDLRVQYLEKVITESEFKDIIQRNDKKNKKNTEISQVINLASSSITDIVYRLMDDLNKSGNGKHNIDSFLGEIRELVHYCNEIFRDISFTYNTVLYKFAEDLTFKRHEKEKMARKKAAASNDTDSD